MWVLHSGNKVTLTLLQQLIRELCIDMYRFKSPVMFPADANAVHDTMFCTCLVNESGVKISTVEH